MTTDDYRCLQMTTDACRCLQMPTDDYNISFSMDLFRVVGIFRHVLSISRYLILYLYHSLSVGSSDGTNVKYLRFLSIIPKDKSHKNSKTKKFIDLPLHTDIILVVLKRYMKYEVVGLFVSFVLHCVQAFA